MSQTTIGWTAVQDSRGRWYPGFTFNPWRGCAKVSAECTFCYAESIDARFWGGEHWGPRAPRAFQGADYWKKPLEWNRRALALGVRLRVFCGSVCDWLEEREDLVEARAALFELIDRTPGLDWLMLTKRPYHLLRLTPWRVMAPGNVWLGTSAGTQEALDRRLPELRQLGAVVHFVSAEPLLERVELGEHALDWLIIGSERSNATRRMPDDAWLDVLLAAAQQRGVPVFLKQWQRPGARAGTVEDMPERQGRQWLEQPRAAGWQVRTATPQRTCAARRCTVKVPPKLLMCAHHWRMVPRTFQAAVWRHYQPGQEVEGGATAEYFDAVHQAVDAVDARELGVPHVSGQMSLPFAGGRR